MTWTIRIFRTLALTTAAALLALTAFSLPASAAAEKNPLLANPSGNCSIGATGGTTTNAFAIVNFHGGDVSATVSLKDGAANSTYSVSLVQTPSGENCFAAEATLTTNGQGNGTVHLDEPVLAGQTGAFVLVTMPGELRVSANVPS